MKQPEEKEIKQEKNKKERDKGLSMETEEAHGQE